MGINSLHLINYFYIYINSAISLLDIKLFLKYILTNLQCKIHEAINLATKICAKKKKQTKILKLSSQKLLKGDYNPLNRIHNN